MGNGNFGGLETLLVDYVLLGGEGKPDGSGVVVLFFIVSACEEVGLGGRVGLFSGFDMLEKSARGFRDL